MGRGQRGGRLDPSRPKLFPVGGLQPILPLEQLRQDRLGWVRKGLPFLSWDWGGTQRHPTSATQSLGLDTFPGHQPAAGAPGAVFLVPGTGVQETNIQQAAGAQKSPRVSHVPQEVGVFSSQNPTPAKHGLMRGPHPKSLLHFEDLIPQALQRGVPSSASLQSGVLWVLQEAQRRRPEREEAKGQGSEAKSPSSGGLCGVGILRGVVSVKAPPSSGPAPVLPDLRQKESQEGRQMAKLSRGRSRGCG